MLIHINETQEGIFFAQFQDYLIERNSWFSITGRDGHVGAQSNGKMSLKFSIIIESNYQKTFFAIVLYTNMVAVTSRENRE